MSHVSPHRWADAFAGRISDDERAEMDRHAERCRKCARSRLRVQKVSDSFQDIRSKSSPELSWDEVRARVHWHVSTERRAKVRDPRKPRFAGVAIATGALAAAAAVALLTGPLDHTTRPAPAQGAPIAIAPRVLAPSSPTPAAPTPLAGIVNRATGDVMIDGILAKDLFSRRLVAGMKLATGNGSVDVQFAENSGFTLGPRSMLELRSLDATTIELVVEGLVDVEVAPRKTDQRFLVVAGDRTVEVRGTQFRIRHDGKATFVACRHGVVAVRDASGSIELPAARQVEVPANRAVASQPIATMSADDLAVLEAATPMTLRAWDLEALIAGSSPLEIATAGRRDVRVDGVELGQAPMRVRVLPGRHTVEVADGAGRYRRAGWVDVGGKPARLEIAADPPPSRGIGERRRQLATGMDRPRLAHCTRAIAKSGLTGTYVQIEISVDANGAVNFLNVIDTDLPNATASCVRDALADIRFGKGAAATWRERIDL